MSGLGAVLLVLTAVVGVLGVPAANVIPSGFILDVKADCGSSRTLDRPVLHVKTDLNVVIKASCSNGVKTFSTTDKVNYALSGTFYQGSKTRCQFHRRSNSEVYTVIVYISYGEGGSPIQKEPEAYSLTCTFARKGLKSTKALLVQPGFNPPVELRSEAGSKTTSVLTLNIYNVRDEIIKGSIVRGCRVYLAATTSGKNSEVGLRPVSCDAISATSGKRLPILRAGCSTKALWPALTGFTTLGRRVRSPYFEMIQIEDDQKISFECVFTLCKTSCNGSSCAGSRPKRSSGEEDAEEVVRSEVVTVE
ncbi:vitelline envelope sperm lysin receptor [Patella vulgata]|uniref:vitelline envelope sperm lysin receptor n=1 Tax=Patella vulgata TaxID=6465 RepID=UPI00217F6C25|nr:vitelline envelope sperm lysin receptor [Patella vulgata]